MAELVD
ncbi:hypothetical protein ECEC4422_5095, partial [Escherichia coli EC4422]